MFLCVAVNYYGLSAWLPNAYQELGWSEGHAALLIGIFNLATLPAGLFVTFFGDRFGSRRAFMLCSAAALTVGTVLLIEAPAGAYAWAFIGGFGNGMMFPLMMTMPLDVARRPADVSAVTGMMLGFGYSLAAIAPFAAGRGARLDGIVPGQPVAARRHHHGARGRRLAARARPAVAWRGGRARCDPSRTRPEHAATRCPRIA